MKPVNYHFPPSFYYQILMIHRFPDVVCKALSRALSAGHYWRIKWCGQNLLNSHFSFCIIANKYCSLFGLVTLICYFNISPYQMYEHPLNVWFVVNSFHSQVEVSKWTVCYQATQSNKLIPWLLVHPVRIHCFWIIIG